MFRDALGTVTQTPPKLLDIAQIAAASPRCRWNRQSGARWYTDFWRGESRACFRFPRGRVAQLAEQLTLNQ